jgi:hypothetical protein
LRQAQESHSAKKGDITIAISKQNQQPERGKKQIHARTLEEAYAALQSFCLHRFPCEREDRGRYQAGASMKLARSAKNPEDFAAFPKLISLKIQLKCLPTLLCTK